MRNQKMQCLLIGKSPIYNNLVKALGLLDTKLQLRAIANTKKSVVAVLNKMKGSSIIFVSDEDPFPLALLSDLIWQHNSNAIVVIVTKKTASTPLKKLFNDTSFAKLNVEHIDATTQLLLSNLIQMAEKKSEFGACKKLLSVAERRCTWLIDSSNEAIAYISRDLHIYANTAYLALFGIDSLSKLRAVSIKDLIIKDESEIFDDFLKYQTKHQKLSHTLLLSMQNKKGIGFRANIHAIPSVFKGRSCWQLWVHKVSKVETELDRRDELRKEEFMLSDSKKELLQSNNPFEVLDKELLEKKKEADSDLILKGLIKRKEVSISALKLTPLKSYEKNKAGAFKSHYVLSLKVPVAQRKGVDDLLFRPSEVNWGDKRQIFWDKVKVARLIQMLSQKRKLEDNYLITLDNASICDPVFTRWMLKSLGYLGIKSKNLTVMIPSQLNRKESKCTIDFVQRLKAKQCKIAINEFTTKTTILKMLRHIRPDYVRISLAWVRDIASDEKREIALGSLIRQLEERNIKVIAPCDFSLEMRKLFSYSGASFCQERSTKTT